jgi:hypothetical protein
VWQYTSTWCHKRSNNEYSRFEVSTAVEIKIEDLWILTSCGVTLKYHQGSKVHQNFGILPQHNTASQPTRHRLEWILNLKHLKIRVSFSIWVFRSIPICDRGCIQKFPDWVDNEIYAYNNKHLLGSNTKDYGGKTH